MQILNCIYCGKMSKIRKFCLKLTNITLTNECLAVYNYHVPHLLFWNPLERKKSERG